MVFFLLGSSVYLILYLTLLYSLSYQDFQIVGVRLKPRHQADPDTGREVRRSKNRLTLGFAAALILQAIFLLPNLKALSMYLMLVLIAAYIAFGIVETEFLRRRLLRLKDRKGWHYETSMKLAADLAVSRERGKSAPPAVWIWLSWAPSVLPLLFLRLSGGREVITYVMFLLLPLILLILPATYKGISLAGPRSLSHDTKVNVAYARASERVSGRWLIVITFLTSVFWCALTAALLFASRPTLWIILTLVLFTAGIIGIVVGLKRDRDRLLLKYYDEKDWILPENGQYYRWGFYINKKDPRLLVPKQVESMGWTLNLAHPGGKAIVGGTAVFILGMLAFVLVMVFAQYKFSFAGDQFKVDLPFYGASVTAAEVQTVRLEDQPIAAIRINGYAGSDRRYGSWRINGYGPVRLYVYNQVKSHIVLELKDKGRFRAIILNEETEAGTRALYGQLENWLKTAAVKTP